MSNWSEKFIKSQVDFFAKNDSQYSVPTHEHIKNLAKDCGISEVKIFEAALAVLANQYLCELAFTMRCLEDKCESPIEKYMALALWLSGNALTGQSSEIDITGEASIPEHYQIKIKPQTKIGVYRVDFLIQYRIIIPKIVNGEIVKDIESFRQMVIECDGHDFHEKTKEQAKKDKERDRALQSLGFLVFRYTGSEVWDDVFKCANEAINAIMDAANKEADSFSEQ